MKSWVYRVNGLFFIAFVASVLVQYNDPDPWRWGLFYGAAAAACGLFHWAKLPWYIPTVLALVALLWCGVLLPEFFGQVSAAEIFASLRMHTEAVEEAREAGGAALVAVWMAVLGARIRRQR